MPYYRRYHFKGYHNSNRVSKRRHLTQIFGGIDNDIERAFLDLPSFKLESLFMEYGSEYGKSAELYARRTYPQWKSGTTKLSGKTAERLLELLPPRLSSEKRYELIKKLRNYYLRPTRENISTPPELWKEHVIPIIEKVIDKSRSFTLPNHLYAKAKWLTGGDTKIVNHILQAIEEEEARQRTAYLNAEFKRIEAFINNVKNTHTASHVISIPQGEIHVTIQMPKTTFLQLIVGTGRTKMNETSHELVPREKLLKALAIQQSQGSLLNLTLDDLSEQQKNELYTKIVEERIHLDVSQAQAEQRFHNSTRDMASTVQTIRELEQSSKNDYTIQSQFNTSSGNTQITVKKNNNTVIIVVAIVVGIILFLLLGK